MKSLRRWLWCAAVVLPGYALAGDATLDAAVGGAVGGAIGGAVGETVGGRDGAIIGAGVGAAVGAAANTEHEGPPPDHRTDGHHGGHGPSRGHFCPPGQAKKGNC